MEDKKSGRIRKKKTYYAQVSNIALRDETMSLKAKGLLALIESYLNIENFTLYKHFLMSKSLDGETAFRSAWKELKEHGYLIQYKLKDKETKQFYYEYEICDNPHIEANISPQVENDYVEDGEPQVNTPQVENPHMATPPADSLIVESLHDGSTTSLKPPTYNNDIIKNNILKNIILTNIDYNTVFVDSLDKELVDNIVNIVEEVLCTDTEFIKINKINISMSKLKSMFLQVNMNHINYVLDVIKSYDKPIGNIKSFVIATLYNSVLTLDLHYSNLINVDMNK